MPIVGLTGRGARFPEIGKLFKGAKKEKKIKDGREYEVFGKELDHWRFESTEPHIVEAFLREFGEQPREIPVYLPFSRTAENFEAWQEAYTAGGLAHRCDGRECVLWFDEKSQTYRADPQPCPTLTMTPEKARRDGCKQVARLRVVIPSLNQLGFVTVETHSKNDILHLDSALPAYESLRPEGLRGVPMILSRVQREISTSGDGKRSRRAKWLINLKPHPEWAALYLDAQRQNALAAVSQPLMLTTNLAEDDEDELIGEIETERDALVRQIHEVFMSQGATQEAWEKFAGEHVDGKGEEYLRATLEKVRAKASAKASKTVTQQPQLETVSV